MMKPKLHPEDPDLVLAYNVEVDRIALDEMLTDKAQQAGVIGRNEALSLMGVISHLDNKSRPHVEFRTIINELDETPSVN